MDILVQICVKDIYSCLVQNDDTPKCIENWSRILAMKLILKPSLITFLGLHMRNASDGSGTNCYITITDRFLFQRPLVDSTVCLLHRCQETLYHMVWDCQDYWFDVQRWLKFTHFTDTIFSKEFVIPGSKVNMVNDRKLDLCILTAQYNIFTSKVHVTIPHLTFFSSDI